MGETERRRTLQIAYNLEHGIEPTSIMKAIREVGMRLKQVAEAEGAYEKRGRPVGAGEMPKDELARLIKELESQMKEAAKQLEFERAAALRDEVVQLRGIQAIEHGPESMLEGMARTTRGFVRPRGGQWCG